MSIRKGSTTIASSVPATEWGSIEGNITDQADLANKFSNMASSNSPTLTGTPTAPTAAVGTNNNQIATTKFVNDSLQNVGSLPDQTGQSGKYLTTDGTTASWGVINALPSQSGQSGKFLSTNGITTSWTNVLPSQADNSGKFLKTDGSSVSWSYALTNSGTGSNALAISGKLYDSSATGANSLALLGHSKADNAIQIGPGTNTEANSFYVGTGGVGHNWKLLDNNGKIPNDRLSDDVISGYKNYVASREENLITNGFLSLKNNYNFSEFTFDSSDLNNSSSGCIKSTDVNASKYFDEKIYVDITKGYKFKYDVKTNNASASFVDRFVSYDVDDNLIANNQCSWIENTTTTLTQKIQDGDTVIHLSDVSNFTDDTAGLIIWNYSNSNGYTYPKETYSRNVYTNLWSSISDIDTVNNTITLSSAWEYGEVANGTFVSQCSADTSTATNIHNSYLITSDVWVTKKAYITPSKFKQGTAYIKLGWNFNKNVGAATTKWTNISLTRDVDYFNAELLGTPTAPTAQTGTSTTQIATTEFVSNALAGTSLSGGKFISVTNNEIDYTGTQLFKLATRSLTYAQWIASYERGVTSTTTASYTITGLRVGDFVTVEGICTDRSNVSVLANGVVTAINGTSVTATYYGLSFQNEGSVVHTSGDESISGTKTFTTSTYMQGEDDMAFCIKSLNADNTATSQSVDTVGNYRVIDKNNKIIGDIRFNRMMNGSSIASIYARTYATGTQSQYGDNAVLQVGITKDGEQFTYAPKPDTTSSTSLNNIATVGWVNDDTASTNVVHRSGTETISGDKTFTTYSYFKHFILNKIDSNLEGGQINFEGADNEVNYGKNCWIDRYNGAIRIGGYNSSNVANNPLTVDIENNLVTSISPTLDNDVSQRVVTTEWKKRNDNLLKSNCLIRDPINVYITLANAGTSSSIITAYAGNVYYIPDGPGVYTKYTLTSQCTSPNGLADGLGEGKALLCFRKSGGMHLARLEYCYSGTTQPSSTYQFPTWYDTTNNIIKESSSYGSSYYNSYISLPIAIVSVNSNGYITNIDQAFNGFGFIGSHIYALPGVEGIIPNYKQTDGTLNNTLATLNNVYLCNVLELTDNWYWLRLGVNYFGVFPQNTFYNSNGNIIVYNGTKQDQMMAGRVGVENGRVTWIQPKQIYHNLDVFDTIQSIMPGYSSGITETTASGTRWVAPSNGWVSFLAQIPNNFTRYFVYVIRNNISNGVGIGVSYECQSGMSSVFPVCAGDIIYNDVPDASGFKSCIFYPCIGA